MIFGRQPQGQRATLISLPERSGSGRRGLWWLFATLLVMVPLMLLTAGCGGGSSSGPSTGGPSGGSRDARITGRLVDEYNNNAPVAGATIHYASLTTLSGTDGTFSLAVASGQGTVNLTIDSPASINYYSTGKVNSQPIDIHNSGIPIPSLQPNQVYSLGDVVLYSESGPPPPPLF